MSFLADENFPRLAVEGLRQCGFDVQWISEIAAGVQDDAVLAECMGRGRTLLTLDKDFGKLVFRLKESADCGVILFRLETESPDEFVAIALNVLESRVDWKGFFTVVTRDKIRMTPILR